MRRLAKPVLPFCLLVLLLLPLMVAPAAAAAPAPTFDQAVDQLIAQGYPQRIETYLNSLGSNSLGFRFGGSPSDNEAARYIAAEYRALGLTAVLDPVPVDVWDVRDASVTWGGRTIVASTFGASPPTPLAGFSRDVVYVGPGTKAAFDAAEARYGPLAGKIALVDFQPDWWWVNWPGHEADLHGIAAIILTTTPIDLSYYSDSTALGSNDGEYSTDWPPFVYIPRDEGDLLRSALGAGSVSATVKNDVRVTMAAKGGTGYNVLATLKGSGGTGQKVLFGSHHDAYFRSGIDNTSSVATQLLIAKSLKMSGYKPYRDMVFLATTSEEWGVVDSYYDWCIGSWYFITQAHTDWAGKIAGFLNMEGVGCQNGQTRLYYNPEMGPWVASIAVNNNALTGNAPEELNPWANSYHDQWPLVAAGVPSISLNGKPAAWYAPFYHTNKDVQELIDWSFLAQNTKLMFRFAKGLDGGLLPYSPKARADDLAANYSGATLVADGADATVVGAMDAALGRFAAEAAAYEARKAAIPAKRVTGVNTGLLALEKKLNSAFTALDVWDGTVYPHQQVQWDLEYFNAAIGELSKVNPVAAKATGALDNLGFTWYGPYFSDEVYERELWRHAPGFPRLTWGAQAKLAIFWNVMPQYRLIEAGEYATAKVQLEAMRTEQIADLESRLVTMTGVLDDATTTLAGLK
jgi:hypothetical protein